MPRKFLNGVPMLAIGLRSDRRNNHKSLQE